MTFRKDYFNFFIVFTSIISILLTLFNYGNLANGYQNVIFLPIIFILIYIFLLERIKYLGFPFTFYGIIVMQWIRFVLLPPVLALAGDEVGFSYINPSLQSIELAIILMIYEMVIVSVFTMILFRLLNKRVKENLKEKKMLLKGNKIIYLLFLFLVVIIFLTVGRTSNLVNFIYIPIEGNGRLGDITDTYLVLFRQIIIVGLFLLFIWTVNYCRNMYEKTGKYLYIDISILAAVLNIAVIVGERRTAQVYIALVCSWVLLKSFPKQKKRILFFVVGTAGVILFLMSVYKFFGAFMQGSYTAAVSNANVDIHWISRTLQSYFFGPENIAIVLDFAKSFNLGISNILFDFMRSSFGISFLMKDSGVLTSELFNTFVYGTHTSTGHVISAVGYGTIFFGIILSPIIVLLNISISTFVERIMYNSKSYEMAFIWGYVLVRFATNLFVSTPPLISNATITLGTGGLLFFISIIFNFKNKQYSIRRGPS